MTNSQIYADLGEKMRKFAQAILIACLSTLISIRIFPGLSTILIVSIMGGLVNVFVKYLNFLRSLQNLAYISKNQLLNEAQRRHYFAIVITIFSALILYMIGADLIYKTTIYTELIYLLIYFWHMILMISQNLANQPLINWFNSNFAGIYNRRKSVSNMAELLHYGTILQALIILPIFTIPGLYELGNILKSSVPKSNENLINLGSNLERKNQMIENSNKCENANVYFGNKADFRKNERNEINNDRMDAPLELRLHRIENFPLTTPLSAKKFEFCIECGLNLPDGAVFCPNCGKEIDFSIKDMIIAN